MRSLTVSGSLALVACFGFGIAAGAACGGSRDPSTDTGSGGSGGSGDGDANVGGGSGGGSAGGSAGSGGTGGGTGGAGGGSANSCTPCMGASDCKSSESCAQFGGDIYCGVTCNQSSDCGSGQTCTQTTSPAGDQVSVCVNAAGACGDPAPPPTPDAGKSCAPSETCGTLVGPDVPANCVCAAGKTCGKNNCYGGWYCDTQTNRCHAPPTNCPADPSCNGGSGGGGGSGGAPPIPTGGGKGAIGNSGGSQASLYFAIVGDTRPPVIDDTKAYPTPIITKIYSDIQALSPSPPFVVATGDYIFTRPTNTSGVDQQFGYYDTARAAYQGKLFPTMGNHECDGRANGNCTIGSTENFKGFMKYMLGPIQKTQPYYEVDIQEPKGAWTAKFLFVAANAWDQAQATWLESAMSKNTTYTFIVRHEPKATTTTPGVKGSEAIMAMHPYTLAIVGHTHLHRRTSTREVVIGNGGAPLVGGGGYGFGLVTQRADKAIQVDMIDYQTGASDSSFRFALKPDGTPAP